jgi:hypothetical protein
MCWWGQRPRFAVLALRIYQVPGKEVYSGQLNLYTASEQDIELYQE